MDMPAWFSAALTDAATGETFTIQDFKGKVVLVETMAMWCPTCLRQQKEVKALHDLLGERDDFVSVGIGVDINENLAALKDYTAKNGFDWTYTVATAMWRARSASCTASNFSIRRPRRCSSSIGTARCIPCRSA